MLVTKLIPFVWGLLALLVVGTAYLIIEGVRVNKLFAESIVGRLVRTLVVVVIIELYSVAIVTYAYLVFYPEGVLFIMPIMLLWVVSLVYAIFAVRAAKQQVTKLIK